MEWHRIRHLRFCSSRFPLCPPPLGSRYAIHVSSSSSQLLDPWWQISSQPRYEIAIAETVCQMCRCCKLSKGLKICQHAQYLILQPAVKSTVTATLSSVANSSSRNVAGIKFLPDEWDTWQILLHGKDHLVPEEVEEKYESLTQRSSHLSGCIASASVDDFWMGK